MSKNLEQNFDFALGRSRILSRVVSILHALALVASWMNSLPPFFHWVLSVLVIVSWRRQLLSLETGSTLLRYTPNAGWYMSYAGTEYLPIVVQSSTVVSRLLIALHYKLGSGKCRTLLIAPDAMSSTDYRKLSVCLIISGQANN